MTPIDDRITAWLDQLERELGGDDPAIRHDAVADAREHLVAARGELGDDASDEAVSELLDQYGSPQEVADSYRDAERLLLGEPPARPDAHATAPMHAVDVAPSEAGPGWLSVVRDPEAWSALLYMLLALPLGIAGFVWTVAGGATAGSLLILIIGVPLALAFLASIRGIALLEGRIVETLLGERMPRRTWVAATDGDAGLVDRVKYWLRDRRTWTSIVYLLTMLPLGIAYFTAAVTLLGTGLGMLGAPILLAVAQSTDGLDAPWWSWVLSGVAVPGGALALLGLLHVARFVGALHGRYTKAMLVGGEGAARRRRPVAPAASAGRAAVFLGLAALVAGGSAIAGAAIQHGTTHMATRQFDADHVRTLVIDGSDADVDFITDEALGAGEVRAVARVRVQDDGNDATSRVSLTSSGSTATLHATCSSQVTLFSWDCGASVAVHVGPDSDLVLQGSTDTGDIHLAGTYRRIELRADTGDIEGDVDAPQVDLQTDTGDVEVNLSEAVDRFRASADTGDVTIGASGTWAVETSTDTGDTSVGVATDRGADREMRLVTDTGDIVVGPGVGAPTPPDLPNPPGGGD
ncbi:MAG: hypothetical protein JWM98_3303 [Thermoleophilia bacterium]|nr:hypothetical protein [Thermoleophilia bacterium]